MRTRRFGPLDVDVSIIGQGTWKMEHDNPRLAIETIRRGIALGVTHIDTAEMYGNGEVESLVGRAIAGLRDCVFLVSKVLPHHASRRRTVQWCEASLARLRTDYLDLYLLHWTGAEPLEDTIAAFDELQRNGKIRAFGVSNFDVEDLEQASRVAGEGRIVCNQVIYNLKQRAIEHRVLPWCRDRGIAVVGYSPFGSGDFPTPAEHGGAVLDGIAAAHSATAHQVALAFLTTWSPVFTIPKTSTPRRVEENAAAADLRLSHDELVRIDAAFPLGPLPAMLPTL